MQRPPKVDVVGTGVSVVDVATAVEQILSPPPEGLVVAVSNVHSVMSARKSPELAMALGEANIVTPDGMPLVWAQRASGVDSAERVDGLRLFTHTISAGLERGTNHYFYGSTPETLGNIRRRLEQEHPGVQIAGMVSPAFRPLSHEEQAADAAAIMASGAHVVWVGLGMPKQELWMHRMRGDLPGVSLVGVGAVFDWVAGDVRKAPAWMQRAGLEWLYRLAREPRRLWRRYIWNNPAYLGLLAVQLVRRRLAKPSTARS